MGEDREARLLETARCLLVDLEDIPFDTAHPLDCALEVPWIDAALAKSEGSAFADGSLSAQLLQQSDGRILLRGKLDARFRVPCARCLSDAEVDAGGELVLTFVQRGHEYGAELGLDGSDEGLELTAEALDELSYEGSKLDLAPMVREQLLLAIPMKALCERGEACRGLCGRCGKDLNEIEADTPNCPSCGLPLIEGASDPEDADEEAQSPWKAALRKISDESED